MLKQAVLFCAVLVIASAFLERQQLEPIPEKFKDQTGCFIEELDAVLKFGAVSPSKARCVEYRCIKDLITIAGCSAIDVRPPCTLVEDKSKPYPDCCPTVNCPSPLK